MKNTPIPTWISLLNNPDDIDILVQLVNYSSTPLESPRSIRFAINDIVNEETATNLAHYISERGWQVSIESDANDEKLFWIEATKDDYTITEQSLPDDISFFERISKMYGASFDGWEAEAI